MAWQHKVEAIYFRPETALFHQLGVNLRIRLCGVKHYASAQMLDFLDLAKNYSFPNRKLLCSSPDFPDGHDSGYQGSILTTFSLNR